jgi:C4-dicarboxylate transporter, DctM subunit
MTPFEIGILWFVFLFLMMMLGMPIAFSMGFVGFLGIWVLEGLRPALAAVGSVPFSWAAEYNFMCIPLFVFMGHLANMSGIIAKAYEAAYKWVGVLPGGLAIASTIGCGAFGAVSGSSSAAAAAMSTICIPQMQKYNYAPKLMTSSIAMGGTLAILIPPSVSFIIYGILTGESIGKLFIAGVIPGIILVIMLSITIALLVKRNPSLGPAGPSFPIKEKVGSIFQMWEVFIIFLIVIGGLYSGVFTPTEAASVGVLAAFVFCLTHKSLSKKKMIETLTMTGKVTVMIFAMIIGAMIFNNFVTYTGTPALIQDFIGGLGANRYVVLAVMLGFFLFFGCIMDALAMTVLLVPIFYPVATGLGFDGIWFGVIVTVLIEIGMLTPPIGINCFVVSTVTKYPLGVVFSGILPFVIITLVLVLLMIVFPQIVLFLPGLMG